MLPSTQASALEKFLIQLSVYIMYLAKQHKWFVGELEVEALRFPRALQQQVVLSEVPTLTTIADIAKHYRERNENPSSGTPTSTESVD